MLREGTRASVDTARIHFISFHLLAAPMMRKRAVEARPRTSSPRTCFAVFSLFCLACTISIPGFRRRTSRNVRDAPAGFTLTRCTRYAGKCTDTCQTIDQVLWKVRIRSTFLGAPVGDFLTIPACLLFTLQQLVKGSYIYLYGPLENFLLNSAIAENWKAAFLAPVSDMDVV